MAVRRLEDFFKKHCPKNKKPIFALKCDVRKFFDSIDQDVLLGLIKQEIQDPRAIALIEKIIKSFQKEPGRGLPLGNVTSQLFANIYLNEFDQFIKRKLKIRYYIRYADDFIVLSLNKGVLISLIPKISDFLKNNLKLHLHPDKTIVRKYWQGIDFLGYVLRPRHRLLRTKTKHRLLRKINRRNKSSYLGLLKHCDSYKLKQNLPAWANGEKGTRKKV